MRLPALHDRVGAYVIALVVSIAGLVAIPLTPMATVAVEGIILLSMVCIGIEALCMIPPTGSEFRRW